MESHEKVNMTDPQSVDQSLTSPSAACSQTVDEAEITESTDNEPVADANVAPLVTNDTAIPAAPLSDDSSVPGQISAPLSFGDILERLKALAAGDGSDVTAEEVGRLKQAFYNLVNESMAVQRDRFVADGNDPESFVPAPVPEEPEFKELMASLKALRTQYRAKIEAEQLANLERKQAIVNELMTMAADTDNVNRHYPRAKELQAEFKTIGDVPQEHTTKMWKSFQDAVELFYDQWKVNKELRDYDFKKNLLEKQLLIDSAVALKDESDIVTAFRRLQDLHDKWRATGPVAKDIREEIWSRFKDASAEINKRYQAFFEERKQREQANEMAKTALCERIEAISPAELTSFVQWNEATEKIIEAQKEWKTLGYASRKSNNQLFARFRATCDSFFAAKAEFFKTMKKSLADNLAAKNRLCEQAEALVDSTEWRKTSDAFVELQKQWKTIGAVPKKQSDAVWQRFMTACNTFFDRKKHATVDVRRAEQANLKAKRQIVARLTELNAPDSDVDRQQAIDEINTLRSQWQETGHVPFKEKDKLHDAYREVVRLLFDKYDIHERRARMDSFQSSIEAVSGDRSRLLRERDRLMRAYEGRKSELATYENNLSFLSARSRSGASLVGDMERNIQRIRTSISELEGKIRIIDEKLTEQ